MADLTIKLKAEAEITNMKQIRDMFKSFDTLSDDIRDAIIDAFADEAIDVNIAESGEIVGYFEDIRQIVMDTKVLLQSIVPYISPIKGPSSAIHLSKKIEELERMSKDMPTDVLNKWFGKGGREAIEQMIFGAKIKLGQLLDLSPTKQAKGIKEIQEGLDAALRNVGAFHKKLAADPSTSYITVDSLSQADLSLMGKLINFGEQMVQQVLTEVLKSVDVDAIREIRMGNQRKYLDILIGEIIGEVRVMGASIKTESVARPATSGEFAESLSHTFGFTDKDTEQINALIKGGKDPLESLAEVFGLKRMGFLVSALSSKGEPSRSLAAQMTTSNLQTFMQTAIIEAIKSEEISETQAEKIAEKVKITREKGVAGKYSIAFGDKGTSEALTVLIDVLTKEVHTSESAIKSFMEDQSGLGRVTKIMDAIKNANLLEQFDVTEVNKQLEIFINNQMEQAENMQGLIALMQQSDWNSEQIRKLIETVEELLRNGKVGG